MYYRVYSNNELYHFGILGMKWGVRRYQNPDGTLTPEGKKRYGYNTNSESIIPKGTVMYRTSTNKSEDFSKGSAYVSVSKVDRNYYRGGSGASWIRGIAKENGLKDEDNKLYEYKLTLKNDVKLAQKQDVINVIQDLNKRELKKVMDAGFKCYEKFADLETWQIAGPEAEKAYSREFEKAGIAKTDYTNPKFKEVAIRARKAGDRVWKKEEKNVIKRYQNLTLEDAFDRGIARSFGGDEKVRNMVVNELKSKGFNAMIDQASIGTKNKWGKDYVVEGDAPLIVFDRSMLETTKISQVSDRDSAKAGRDYYRWKNKTTSEVEKRGYYK